MYEGGEELETIERDKKKKKIEKNRAKAIYRKSQFSMDREVSRGVKI